MLEVLSKAGRPLSELRTDFERYADSGEINTEVADPGRGDRGGGRALRRSASQDRLDGLTVDLGEWWFNLRPSNTEPLLRLNLEAADRECLRGPDRGGPVADRRQADSSEERRAMALDPKLLEILACPKDKGPLLYFADEDRCTTLASKLPLPDHRRHSDHAHRRSRDGDEAEHQRLLAKAEAEGIDRHASDRRDRDAATLRQEDRSRKLEVVAEGLRPDASDRRRHGLATPSWTRSGCSP